MQNPLLGGVPRHEAGWVRPLALAATLILVLTTGCGKAKHDPHAGHNHGGGGGSVEPAQLSPEALKGLGLEVKPVEKTSFTRYETVQAVAELPPLSVQPLVAPVSGRIESVPTGQGKKATAADDLVKLVRDPLPRVQLTLTEDLLKIASEETHETAVNLRKALAELQIVETELERLQGLQSGSEGSLVPRQTLVDLQYQHTRAEKEVYLLRARLRLHGMSEADIDALAAGEPVKLSEQRWQASLRANGLWSDAAEKLHQSLPDANRNLPWNVAAIGELGALGLLSPGLQAWAAKTPTLGEHLIFVAGLMQAGHSLEDVKNLHALGAFEDVVQLQAPAGPAQWTVQSLAVRPGERVEAGAELLTLVDPSSLYLKIQPAGRELAALQRVIKSRLSVAARPLVKDTGLSYRDLKISHLQSEGADMHPVAYMSISNSVLAASEDHVSWAVQPGTRYVVELPVQRLENVWVLPSEAVAEDGADRVVFVENGDTFTATKVIVLFQDDRVAVLSPASGLFPGDPVVTRNAFGLSLALNSGGSSEVDPHAGHSH